VRSGSQGVAPATGSPTATHLLDVRELRVRFTTGEGSVYAVNGVTLSLDTGETLGLVGESGSGKSVTSLAVMRLLPPAPGAEVSGEVLFDGHDLAGLSEKAMRSVRGKDIAMVFQDPMTSLNPVLRIGKQIEETIRAHRDVAPEAAHIRAGELLGLVGIPEPESQLRRFPHEFSGGMRQRVMIAIALALEPKLLIADEPTTALDVTIQAQVLELLAKLTAETGTAVILITHDLGIVARMTQQVAVMYGGFIVESAPTTRLFAMPRHPYTVGLLHSIPRLDAAKESLRPIEGSPPHLQEAPKGCPFAPRCAWRLEVCWEQMPPLVPLDDEAGSDHAVGHLLACHNPVRPGEAVLARPDRGDFQAAAPPGVPP
jgi:oligopeptide transport system ATP-binding protein